MVLHRQIPERVSKPDGGQHCLRVVGSSENIRLSLVSDPPGKVEFKGSPRVLLAIHLGPPVEMECHHGGKVRRGIAIHGDIDIIPPQTPAIWELRARDKALAIGIEPGLFSELAAEFGKNPRELEIRNSFQVRDFQIEHLAWALKAEMEAGYPSGRVYLDALAVALGVRLVRAYSSLAVPWQQPAGRMAPRKLKNVLSYIEAHLDQDFRLRDVAGIAGLSVSHFKVLFRRSVGVPAHHYVIERRVDRAVSLLRSSEMPINQVALESGFAHQSHLARHTRRLLSQSPKEIRNAAQ